MDESKPPILPDDVVLQSAAGRTAADIDPPPRSRRHDSPDAASVAVYYRSAEDVREAFLIALRAMGLADAGPHEPEPRGRGPAN